MSLVQDYVRSLNVKDRVRDCLPNLSGGSLHFDVTFYAIFTRLDFAICALGCLFESLYILSCIHIKATFFSLSSLCKYLFFNGLKYARPDSDRIWGERMEI